jgi:hypothetical protein
MYSILINNKYCEQATGRGSKVLCTENSLEVKVQGVSCCDNGMKKNPFCHLEEGGWCGKKAMLQHA